MDIDTYFMELALCEAKKAYAKGEVPVGAVFVLKGEVIAAAHNLVETLQDASAHAEILCMRMAAEHLGNWRLLDGVLYSTLEPCSMCAGAILLSRVGTLVWGAPDVRHGAGGSFVNLFDAAHPTHHVEVRKHVCKEACAELMRSFFRSRRQKNVLSEVGNGFTSAIRRVDLCSKGEGEEVCREHPSESDGG
ncbi:MAG: nucleoside deaminase [Chlamydiales bacterium]|nr:nucleoside deaminase [Chlamydiales bacterium]